MEIVYTDPYQRVKSSVAQGPESQAQQREKVEAQFETLMRLAILYDRENVGGYLSIEATGGINTNFDPSDFGADNSSFYLKTAHDLSFDVTGNWFAWIRGYSYLIFDGQFQISTARFTMFTGGGGTPGDITTSEGFRFFLASSNSDSFDVYSDNIAATAQPAFSVLDYASTDTVRTRLQTSHQFTVRDHSDNAWLRIHDPDGVFIEPTAGEIFVSTPGDFEISGGADGYVHALTNLTLQSFGGLSLFAAGNIFVASTSTATGTSVMSFCINDTNQFLIRDVDTTMDYFRVGSAIARFRLQAGVSFEVADNSDVVIFRVDDDGTLHIPTGKTLVSDL